MIDLGTPIGGSVDCDAGQIVGAIKRHPRWQSTCYTERELWHIGHCYVAYSRLATVRTTIAAGRMLHETGHLTYEGDVPCGSHNFAGIGATGDVPGHEFVGMFDDDGKRRSEAEILSGIEVGVKAQLAHELAYWLGDWRNWPADCRAWAALDPRYQAVIDSGHAGRVSRLGDYTNGRWAYTKTIPIGSLANGYAGKIADKANLIQSMPAGVQAPAGGTVGKLHVVISAGHRNTAGGNHEEQITTAALANELGRQSVAAGHFDVTVMQPDGPDRDHDRGDGMYAGDYNDLARAIVELDKSKRVDFSIDLHTEGTGNTSVRGTFGIPPYWPKSNPSDYDPDAVQIITGIADRLEQYLGLPKRTTNVIAPGVMAEYQTGVGGQGYRLGHFANTAAIKDHCTRFLYEFGAHSNPADFAIQRSPAFASLAARAVVESLVAYCGFDQPVPVPVDPAPVRDVLTFAEVEYEIVLGFKGFFEFLASCLVPGDGGQMVALAWLVLGFPVENERLQVLDGVERPVQLFERGALVYESEAGKPWYVRLATNEQHMAIYLEHARQTGTLDQVVPEWFDMTDEDWLEVERVMTVAAGVAG